ncbi:MAG: 2-oxo acid dehydrogenase subunit E2 [Clostridia bacterium]|nr:2-oxo acid dehydrogenase subunit E2 [Clostridia bacterium]
MKAAKTEYFHIQRKIVANVTTESWQNVPHVTYMYEPDVTEFFRTYKAFNDSRYDEARFTFNTLMLKVITEGLKAAPVMNSHIHFNRHYVTGHIDTFENIDISMPMILPNGEMMTINLHDFDSKNIDEMTAYVKDVRRRAEKTNLAEAMYSVSIDNTFKGLRKGKLLQTVCRIAGANIGKSTAKHLHGKAKKDYEAIPETERLTLHDIEQGTVTVTNVGSNYTNQRGAIALLEIVPPQVCAISVGAVQDKPLVVKDAYGRLRVESRKVLPMCIAFDHRALDFGEIVPFLKHLDGIFANPEIMRTWVSDPTPATEKKGYLTVVA